MSACRSCGAPIVWAKTAKGRSIPLDEQPSAKGNIALVDGVAIYTSADDRLGVRYLSHFVSCPDQKQWKKL